MATMRSYRTASGRPLSDSLSKAFDGQVPILSREVYRETTEILSDSVPLVPVDTGALRGSGYAAEPYMDGNHLVGEVGYGGVATKINPKTGEATSTYALAVHENLDAHHEVGSAKYLEIPFNAKIPGMGDRIATGVKGSVNAMPDVSQSET